MSSGCTVQHLPVREGQTSKHTMTKELKQQLYILVAPLKKRKTLNIYWSAPYLKGRTAPDVYGASIPPPVNVPQVLDFLPHHRNLLIQLIDVLAAAVTRRTHRVQEDTKDRHVSVGQLSARCWTQTNPTQISHVGRDPRWRKQTSHFLLLSAPRDYRRTTWAAWPHVDLSHPP